MDEKFTKQNIYDRSSKLLRRVRLGHTDTASIMKQYEAIDREVLGICRKGEKKCNMSGRQSLPRQLNFYLTGDID